MKKYVFYLLTIALVLQFSSYSYAKSVNELKKQQDNIKNTTEQTKNELENAQQEKSEALLKLEALDIDLNIATEELNEINGMLNETELILKIATMAREQAEIAKKAQYESLATRVRYMYIKGKTGYLDTVLKAKSFSDFLNRLDYMNRIAKHDQEIFSAYEKTESEIISNVALIDKQKLEISILQEEQVKKTEWLERLLIQKTEQVEKLSQDEAMYTQLIDDWDKASSEIEQLIKKAQEEEARKAREAAEAAARAASQAKSTPAFTGGKLGLPLANYRLTSGYGNRPSPFTGKTEFHTGIDMAAQQGTPIYAAESGTVIFSGTIRGYGKTIIIEHGGNFQTLYAHASSLVAQVGQYVQRGEIVAKVGSTGNSTGNHLHFEVRVNGTHTNPAPYLK